MKNITLSIDENIIKRVRKIAIERDTTLTALVRQFLIDLAQQDELARERDTVTFLELSETLSRKIGQRTWSRDELHER